jgi:hypothetical protein
LKLKLFLVALAAIPPALALAVLSECFTRADLNNAECRTSCKRAGYFAGNAIETKYCECVDRYDFSAMTEQRLTLGIRTAPGKVNTNE